VRRIASQEERAFRAEVRAFVRESLPEGIRRKVMLAEKLTKAEMRQWHRILDAKGWVAPAWDDFVDDVLATGFGGDLFVAAPGTILFEGSPAVFALGWLDEFAGPPGVVCRAGAAQRQVYRQCDQSGRPVRDVVRLMLEELPAGQPLLTPVVERGRVVRRFDADEAAARLGAQESAIGKFGLIVESSLG